MGRWNPALLQPHTNKPHTMKKLSLSLIVFFLAFQAVPLHAEPSLSSVNGYHWILLPTEEKKELCERVAKEMLSEAVPGITGEFIYALMEVFYGTKKEAILQCEVAPVATLIGLSYAKAKGVGIGRNF